MFWTRFEPTESFIRIPARILGISDIEWLGMALDTGSNRTIINEEVAWRLGYEPLTAPRVTVTTASGTVSASVVTVRQIFALGITLNDFPVLVMPFPTQLNADGLLGLDFLRRRNLFCNFAKGILLTLPYPQNLLQRFTLTAQLFANL
ncbi:MAG: retropepsin-like aspartic protease [Armatimonadota bacterium]|nr:retropepsin-like aspartic protease [Armatimonadota bacterium]